MGTKVSNREGRDMTRCRQKLIASYQYNAFNQNTVVQDSGQSFRFDYDEFGNVRTYTAANGAGSAFHYNASNLVDSLSIGTKSEVLLHETYEYDKNGNRTRTTRQDDTSKTLTYTYDDVNQLKKETLADGTIKAYTYDGFGNRTGVETTTASGTVTSKIAECNDGNQLTKFGSEVIAYDEDGNRTSDGSYIYGWNAAGQLISLTKKGTTTPFATYKYDDAGRQIEKTVDGQTIRYHYDGDSINVLYETDVNGNVLRQYVYAATGLRLAMKTNGQILYYHYNAHSDVVAMTDSSGNIVAEYEYDAWGNMIRSNIQDIAKGNPFTYAGYMRDSETKLYYLMARYYHPIHGVFLSIDPEPGDKDDPITQNGYTYTVNNPVVYVDLDGQKQLYMWGGGGGGSYIPVRTPVTYKGKLPTPKYQYEFGRIKLKNVPNMTLEDIISNRPLYWRHFSSPNGKHHTFKDLNGKVRIRVDPPDKHQTKNSTNYHHVHFFDRKGRPLDTDGQVRDKNDPAVHIRYNSGN